jgi:type IV secretory pathway TraG/TraD family ATPase VirD4
MGQRPDGKLAVSIGYTQQRRPFLTPEAVRDLPGDEMLVLGDGLPGVIRAGRRPYYQCPELRGMYDPDPYQGGGRKEKRGWGW